MQLNGFEEMGGRTNANTCFSDMTYSLFELSQQKACHQFNSAKTQKRFVSDFHSNFRRKTVMKERNPNAESHSSAVIVFSSVFLYTFLRDTLAT